MGISFYGWLKENIKKIGSLWGDVVCLDRDTELGLFMIFVKILIDIFFFFFIEEWIYFIIRDICVDLYILKKLVVGF